MYAWETKLGKVKSLAPKGRAGSIPAPTTN